VKRLAIALVAAIACAGLAWPAGAQEPLLCRGNVPTILGTPGPDTIVGTPARDVIHADAGDDVVSGEGTGDVICGGFGNDHLGGGGGNDRISGEDDTDVVEGDRGNDRLEGGPGDGDRVRGRLGDDEVNGGPGNRDEALGDLGIDDVNGGEGDNDLVRGDYGRDTMRGGPGFGDVASFATAIPDRTGPSVTASLASGVATGDGNDTLAEFEDLEGSAYADVLSGDGGGNRIAGGPGNDQLDGGGGTDTALAGRGTDTCANFVFEFSCGGSGRPDRKATAEIVPSLAGGSGLFVGGTGGEDRVSVELKPNGTFLVRSPEAPLAPRKACQALAPSQRTLRCQPLAPIHYMLVELGAGDDTLTLGPGLLAAGAVRVGGSAGDDVIRAGEEDDLLQAGDGSDRLLAGAGSDGLLGGPDADIMFGQPGDDLLAAGGPCGGGRLVGNAGDDNGSFARTSDPREILEASLESGLAFLRGVGGCRATSLHASLEDLEGTFGRDVLIGDDGDNGFFGQPGADEFYGRGGNDILNARDGQADRVIDCESGDADEAVTDPTDPTPVGCELGETPAAARSGG
jgi:Ca2+-binding RTX toxin-like protein